MLRPRGRAAATLTALFLVCTVAFTTAPLAEGPEPRRVVPRPAIGTVALDPVLGDQDRPNIVVIMADDMRDDELEHMPRTRELVQGQGVRFVNSFSPHPMCCPARASFLTGKYTHNHQVWSNRGKFGGFSKLDDSETMPVALSAAGYNTVFLGKYLNGYGHSLLSDGTSSVTYVPPGWTDWRAATSGIYSYYNTTLSVNGTLRDNKGWYQTRMLGAESRDIIAQYARSPRPFFLWASYVAPHVGVPLEKDDPLPIEREDGALGEFLTPARPADVRDMFDSTIAAAPGDAGEADVSDKPFFVRNRPRATLAVRAATTEVARQRAESLEVLDQEVAHTIGALERSGELDDTIVVFTSDNGYLLGEHRISGGKTLPYEPSLRVPLVARGPGLPTGATRRDPALTIDFAPTFLQLAGIARDPDIDGVSLLEQGGDPTRDTGWDRAILTETGPRSPSTVTEDDVLPPGADTLRFTQGVRTEGYLYVEHANGERELYDQRADPDQLENIVTDPSAKPVVETMAFLLDTLRDCVGEECQAPLARHAAAGDSPR